MRLSTIAKVDIFIFSPMIKKGVTAVFEIIDNSNACIDLKNSPAGDRTREVTGYGSFSCPRSGTLSRRHSKYPVNKACENLEPRKVKKSDIFTFKANAVSPCPKHTHIRQYWN